MTRLPIHTHTPPSPSQRLRHCRTEQPGAWLGQPPDKTGFPIALTAGPLASLSLPRASGTLFRRRWPGSLHTVTEDRVRSERSKGRWLSFRRMMSTSQKPTSQSIMAHRWIGLRPSKEREIFPSRRLQKGLAVIMPCQKWGTLTDTHFNMYMQYNDGTTASQPQRLCRCLNEMPQRGHKHAEKAQSLGTVDMPSGNQRSRPSAMIRTQKCC